MKLPLPDLLIKTRIYGGFSLLCALIVVLSLVSYFNAKKTSESFAKYQVANNQYTSVLEVGKRISKIQHHVQSYIFTGYESLAGDIAVQLNELEAFFDEMDGYFVEESEDSVRLANLREHLLVYRDTFGKARGQAAKMSKMLESLSAHENKVLEGAGYDSDVGQFVQDSKAKLYEYLYDPDMAFIASVQSKFNDIVRAADPVWSADLVKYRRIYVDIVQAKRNHLFLITVVMAGEASEIQYISKEVIDAVLEKTDGVEAEITSSIDMTSVFAVFASLTLTVLGAGISYSIARSIVKPLLKITETFEELAREKDVGKVPGTQLRDEIGQMSRAAEVFRQNNENIKVLMGSLEQEKEKLITSNKELEQFAFVTSHDLQEPLRSIQNFAELYEEDYHDVMDEDAHMYLKYINDAANRMQQLILGILEYSRIGKQSDYTEFPIKGVVDNVTQDLNFAIEGSDASILVQKNMPVVVGSEIELRSLLTNLISNALKFSEAGKPNQISIGCDEVAGRAEFYVQDTGIGIRGADQEKIFDMFKRLQNQSDYAGHGIGLSHCKKIVESHGGKLWLDTSYVEGSKFIFTLEGCFQWEESCAA